MRFKARSCLFITLTGVIAFVGLVSHALIASGYVDALLSQRVGVPVSVSLPQWPPLQSNVRVYTQVAGNNGVYNSVLTCDEEWVFRYSFKSALQGAIFIATGSDERVWGVFAIPYPFLIPLVVHLVIVWAMRCMIAVVHGKSVIVQSRRLFALHALLASVFAWLIAVVFQSGRMFWASEIWGAGAYLNDSLTGGVCLALLFGLSVLIYLYCVIGTAELWVCRKSGGDDRRCIRCGYAIEGGGGVCQECGLEDGAWIPSKWRINHWYLGAMFVVTFFSPVLVASVYSVFG